MFLTENSTGSSIVHGIFVITNGVKRNIQEKNSDATGLILFIIMLNVMEMIRSDTIDHSVIGEKHTGVISNIIKQSEY